MILKILIFLVAGIFLIASVGIVIEGVLDVNGGFSAMNIFRGISWLIIGALLIRLGVKI